MAISTAFEQHLAGETTTVARCWALTRRDGTTYGFTDHDRDLEFLDITFKADTGLSARALQQTTGLAIDNSEALGALSDAAVTEADIRAGRFDGAAVVAWLVNWTNPSERLKQFRGTLGEITRGGGAFRAELVGLTEALNELQGRVYQVPCSAVLGDTMCQIDLAAPAFSGAGEIGAVEDQKVMLVTGFDAYAGSWFKRGRMVVLNGAAKGLTGMIKSDRRMGAARGIVLWEALRAEIAPGDRVRLEAGCSKLPSACKEKFGNFLNYQGFPDIPGDDRQLAFPVTVSSTTTTGGGK